VVKPVFVRLKNLMATRLSRALALSMLALSLGSSVVQAQDVSFPQIPATLPVAVINRLTVLRTQLLDRLEAHNRKVEAFNARCGQVQSGTALFSECTQKDKELSAEDATLIEDKKGFAAQLNSDVNCPGAPAGALSATSAKEQLFNSGKETTGDLFDGGTAHDDACVDARSPNVAPPAAATPLDPRFAKSKDYQAAAATLTNVQILAETLNKKITGLQDQQKASPTPARQIEIYNLSAQTNQANGAVAIARNNLDTVKKKIIESGPAIIVDDSQAGPAQSKPAPKSQ
jgi:hypothetical protein